MSELLLRYLPLLFGADAALRRGAFSLGDASLLEPRQGAQPGGVVLRHAARARRPSRARGSRPRAPGRAARLPGACALANRRARVRLPLARRGHGAARELFAKRGAVAGSAADSLWISVLAGGRSSSGRCSRSLPPRCWRCSSPGWRSSRRCGVRPRRPPLLGRCRQVRSPGQAAVHGRRGVSPGGRARRGARCLAPHFSCSVPCRYGEACARARLGWCPGRSPSAGLPR